MRLLQIGMLTAIFASAQAALPPEPPPPAPVAEGALGEAQVACARYVGQQFGDEFSECVQSYLIEKLIKDLERLEQENAQLRARVKALEAK